MLAMTEHYNYSVDKYVAWYFGIVELYGHVNVGNTIIQYSMQLAELWLRLCLLSA